MCMGFASISLEQTWIINGEIELIWFKLSFLLIFFYDYLSCLDYLCEQRMWLTLQAICIMNFFQIGRHTFDSWEYSVFLNVISQK